MGRQLQHDITVVNRITTDKIVTYQVSFRIITFWTENKFPDESIQQVLQFIGSVCSIHNKAIILIVKLGLCTELTAKVLCRICNITMSDHKSVGMIT